MMTKHSQLKVIVLKPLTNPGGPGTAEIPADGQRLYNTTTDAFLVDDGFGGFFKEFPNSGNPQAVNGTTAAANVNAAIKFNQNRDTTNDPATLYERPLESSQWITPFCYNGIQMQAIAADAPTNNLLLAGPAAGATATAIPVLDEFTYRLQVSSHGDRTDWYNSSYNTPTTFGTYTSPDWTTTAYTTAQSRAITIESLANNFNNHSQSMSFMFCIDSAASGAAGNTTILSLSDGTVTNGTKVIIGYNLQGQAVTFTMDDSFRQSFAALETAQPGLELRPYLLPGTQNAPANPIAGTTVSTDHFAVMAIDEGQAYYDYRINTKRRITMGLISGFDSVEQAQIATPNEGHGQARQLEIMYKANEQFNQVARPQPYMSYHVAFPNEILADATYDLFFVEHCYQRTATSGMPAFMPHTTVIAVVSYEDPNTPYFNAAGVGVANPQKTYIQDTLNAFNTNFNLGNATLAI